MVLLEVAAPPEVVVDCRGGSEVVDGESSGDRDNEGANDIVETYSWKNSLRVLLSRSSSSGWIS